MSIMSVNPETGTNIIGCMAKAFATSYESIMGSVQQAADEFYGEGVVKVNTKSSLWKWVPDPEQGVKNVVNHKGTELALVTLKGDEESIGAKEFDTEGFAADVEQIATEFGFNKGMLFDGCKTEDEIYKKSLDTLDAIMGVLHLVPLDKIHDVKSFSLIMARGIRTYLPKIGEIGKVLATAPGLNKYAKVIMGSAEALDNVIEQLGKSNEANANSISDAIDSIRKSIAELRTISISDVKSAKDAPQSNENAGKSKKDSKKEKKEKAEKSDPKEKKEKEEAVVLDKDGKPIDEKNPGQWVLSEKALEDAVAFNQNILSQMGFAPAAPVMTQSPTQPLMDMGFIQDSSEITSFLNGNLNPNEDGKSVPAIFAENTLQVKKTPMEQQVFSPIQQDKRQNLIQLITAYPWVGEIMNIANKNGYAMDANIVNGMTGNNALVAISVFNNQAFLPDKSFIVDCGCIIDGRMAIWPCAQSNGTFAYVETCNVAYHLMSRDRKLNSAFIDAVIKYGFGGVDPMLKKSCILYAETMLKTNRRIALIGLSAVKDNKKKSNMRGACIRIAKTLDPALGRFVISDIDEETMSFVLDNENTSDYYCTPKQFRPIVTEITCIPAKDKDGKFIKVSKDGTDTQYGIEFSTRPATAQV